jgi:hypothetical protein
MVIVNERNVVHVNSANVERVAKLVDGGVVRAEDVRFQTILL